MEARQVKAATSVMRNKTDKNDARGIARLLRSGWYRPVHIKSMQSHRIRALLSRRKAVPDKCFDLENKIRGLFKVFGIKLPLKLGHSDGYAGIFRLSRCSPRPFPALSHVEFCPCSMTVLRRTAALREA